MGKLKLTIEGYGNKYSVETSDEITSPMLMKEFVGLAVNYGYSLKNFKDMLGSDPADWEAAYRLTEG